MYASPSFVRDYVGDFMVKCIGTDFIKQTSHDTTEFSLPGPSVKMPFVPLVLPPKRLELCVNGLGTTQQGLFSIVATVICSSVALWVPPACPVLPLN